MKRKTFIRMPSKIAALVFAAVLALTGVMPAGTVWADTAPAVDAAQNGEQTADPEATSETDAIAESEANAETPAAAEAPAAASAPAAVQSQPAALDVSSAEAAAAAEDDTEQVVDIRSKTVTGLAYDQSTGILSWKPLEGAVQYRYRISFKKDTGGMGGTFGTGSTVASVNIYEKDALADTLERVGAAEYTFHVTAIGEPLSDGSDNESIEAKLGPIHFTPDMARLGHHLVKVEVYTYAYSYITKDDSYYESIRMRSMQHGGRVLINGEPINVYKDGGTVRYLRYGEKEFRVGDKVTVSYEPVDSYELQSVKINGQAVTGPQTFTIGDKDIQIDVYFRQPLITFENNGITVSADDDEAAGTSILFSDKTRLKRWQEGYTKVTTNLVTAASLDEEISDICDRDKTLKDKNIHRGTFFNLGIFKSINMGPLESVSSIPGGTKLNITVPDYLTKSGRTYYLVKITDGEAAIVASGKDTTLSADITGSGLYMIGFKSAQASGGGGGGTGDGGYYPGANYLPAEEPEEEPEIDSELLDITPLVAAIVTNTAMSVEVTAQTLLHL